MDLLKSRNRSASTNELSIKALLVGDLKTKKNELMHNYKNNENDVSTELGNNNYTPWIIDNYCKKIKLSKKEVNFTMWDSSGQEDLDQIRKLSYHDIDLVLILFNVHDKDSFENALNKWHTEIKKHSESNKMTIIFIGNHNKITEEKDAFNYIEFFKKKGINYLECQNFSHDILDKMIHEILEIYVGNLEKNQTFSKKKDSCHIF